MNFKLLVIRSNEPKKLAEFYAVFGLQFEYHSHGISPMYYSTDVNGTTLEIYPLTKSQKEADKNLRLGFGIDDFESVIQKLRESGATIHTEPVETDFGYLAVIGDPEGRKIELYKN